MCEFFKMFQEEEYIEAVKKVFLLYKHNTWGFFKKNGGPCNEFRKCYLV